MRDVTKRLVTMVNNTEFAQIQAYADRKKISLYKLLKTALLDYVKRHP